MPLNAAGWTTEEDEKLVDLVHPYTFLYNDPYPSTKNSFVKRSTWQDIALTLDKPVEECKKRWRGLRDSYMRSKRVGAMHKTKAGVFQKLHFLEDNSLTNEEVQEDPSMSDQTSQEEIVGMEQQVITDNQEYYEITVVDGPTDQKMKPFIKIMPKSDLKQESNSDEPPKKINRKNAGRKKSIPMPRNLPPIKILPKPILLNGPKIVQYIEDPKTPEQRSEVIDKLIERVLKENTNEIDVFFRSMAASVKKLQPNLIPKVKMEVCNVIAKYEMQNFDKSNQN